MLGSREPSRLYSTDPIRVRGMKFDGLGNLLVSKLTVHVAKQLSGWALEFRSQLSNCRIEACEIDHAETSIQY